MSIYFKENGTPKQCVTTMEMKWIEIFTLNFRQLMS